MAAAVLWQRERGNNAMCGRFNVIDSPQVRELMRIVGADAAQLRFAPDVAPGATISIVTGPGDDRRVQDAIWWLLLDRQSLKPDYRYASFNTRADKLDVKRSAGYRPFRESRCLIPASAFIEGLGDKRTYHRIELDNRAIAFGGLFKEWVDRDTGERALSASIITLAPPPQWADIHPKSMPLLLPHQSDVLDAWLDPDNRDVAQFDWLLRPAIRVPQILTPIGRPSRWDPQGEAFRIPAESAAE